jgi:hypothetical protein
VGGVLRAQGNGLNAFLFEHLEDGLATRLAEVGGEEPAISDDDTQHWFLHDDALLSLRFGLAQAPADEVLNPDRHDYDQPINELRQETG